MPRERRCSRPGSGSRTPCSSAWASCSCCSRCASRRGGYADAIDGERSSLAMLALEGFDATWMIGLALFGVHLLLVARILWRFAGAPRLVAAALAMAGAVYLIDTVGFVGLVDYESHASLFEAIVIAPAIVGELAVTWWLLARRNHQA
ncbi:MAG: DUF4386 domain-containing protein [Ilumatobacteraceae bacterium]